MAKAKYLSDFLERSDNISKDAWALIKDNSKNKAKPENITLINGNGVKVEDKQGICDTFNDHFTQVGLKFREASKEPTLETNIPERRIVVPMRINQVTPDEVTQAVKRLKNKSSSGFDGVSNKLIKSCVEHISKPLAKIATASFSQGIFPALLKRVTVTPIFKGGDSSAVDSYRPISKVSTFSKTFEILFLNRLRPFLEENNILSPRQFGFVQGKSTGDAISSFISSIISGIERRQQTVGVMMDLSKAFDCVSHFQLLECLRHLGLDETALNWLSSYLRHRQQCVEMNGKRSNWAEVEYGVPQGSILGPILYNLYVNNIDLAIPRNDVVLYADDLAITFSDVNIDNLEINCHITLTQLYQFLNNINLHLNLKKPLFLDFSRISSNSHPSIIVDSSELDQATTFKYLGLHIDDDLKWQTHIKHVRQQLASTIFLLCQLAKYRNMSLLKLVYHGLFETRLRYGLIVWGSANLHLLRKVFALQRRAVRILAGLGRRDDCMDAFRELRLLTFPSLYMYEVIMHARFSSVGAANGTAVHDHNTRASINLRQNRHHSALAGGLPLNVGAKLFSKLPSTLKEINSRALFKKKLKDLLVDGCFYSVGEFHPVL